MRASFAAARSDRWSSPPSSTTIRVPLRGTRSRIINSRRDSGAELAKNGCPSSENTPSSRTSSSAISSPSRSIALTSAGDTARFFISVILFPSAVPENSGPAQISGEIASSLTLLAMTPFTVIAPRGLDPRGSNLGGMRPSISGRNQRRVQPRGLADDAAAVADRHVAIAFGENRRQLSSVQRAQPEPQQVALFLRLGPVLVAGAGVQHRVVVQDLQI